MGKHSGVYLGGGGEYSGGGGWGEGVTTKENLGGPTNPWVHHNPLKLGSYACYFRTQKSLT